MFNYYRMHTDKKFVFTNGLPLADFASEGFFDELDEVMADIELEIREPSDDRVSADIEVKRLFEKLSKLGQKERMKNYARVLVDLFTKKEDYNSLALFASSPMLYGKLPEAAQKIIEKFSRCAEKAAEAFKARPDCNAMNDFEDTVDGINISVSSRALYFENNGIKYRVFWLDN